MRQFYRWGQVHLPAYIGEIFSAPFNPSYEIHKYSPLRVCNKPVLGPEMFIRLVIRNSAYCLDKLCNGQTLLCKALDLKVAHWDQQQFDDSRFYIEPFERGFGTTIGNSLRRVLLSSLEGSAVTSIKIANVDHEFTSVKGIMEDVTDIVLNVKSLVVRLNGEGFKPVNG